MSVIDIVYKLKARGFRETKIRTAMLDALGLAHMPLTARKLQESLARSKTPANKTTVYRALAFLLDQKFIREIQLAGEKKKRYELASREHHHHVVCVQCDKIEDVALSNELLAEEKKISRNKNFTILNHSLEFYGICKTCNV